MSRLLLIGPGHLASPDWGSRAFPAHLHHLWSALFNENGNEGDVDVVDYNILFGAPDGNSRAQFLDAIRSDLSGRRFDVAGISCWSSLNVTASHAVAKIIRDINPKTAIYVGGYHPTARPQDFPRELFDHVVPGCGFQALGEAMGRKGDGASPVMVKPRWEGFGYRGPGGMVGLYLSRGCPFRCSFCMESVMGRSWKALDPEEAAAVVVEAINVTGTPFLQIYDPLFGLNKKWRASFLGALLARRRKFDKKTFIWAQVRSDTIADEDIKKLRRFRVQLAVGLESVSAKILKIMNKTRRPDLYLNRFAELSNYLDKMKVHHQAFLIFNHPGETPDTLEEARRWLMGLLKKKRKSYLTLMGQRYVHFPGSALDGDMPGLNEKYGTRVLHPEWWLEEDGHHRKASAVIPSRELEGAGQLERWKTVMGEVVSRNLEIASDANRPDVESYRDQFEILAGNRDT